MTKLKIDYSEARDWYVKGDKEENGYSYPSLPEIAREFNYSISTLRKKAANEGWLKQRKDRLNLKDTINMRKEFMGKAVKLSNVCFNGITAAEFLIKKVNEEQNEIENGKKTYDIHLATKQIWTLKQAMSLIEKAQETLDQIERGDMSPIFSNINNI
tara:strand:- start:281 stop:751 length:471 start_codon:yes stop_codon:yes gene_type:complete